MLLLSTMPSYDAAADTLGISQNDGHFFGGPCNKDFCIWGSEMGSPFLRTLPLF